MKQSEDNQDEKILFKWLPMTTKTLTLRLAIKSWPVEEVMLVPPILGLENIL